jgi:hypothetical protein
MGEGVMTQSIAARFGRALLPAFLVSCLGCGGTEPLNEVEKAKLITQKRKEAEDQLAIFLQSEQDAEGADVDALLRYVELWQETTKIAPATCPICYANYATALHRLGRYYETLVGAMATEMQKVQGAERADYESRIAAYRGKMLEAFSQSNQQFQNYFDTCAQNSQPVGADAYRYVLRNCEYLKDYNRAIYFLELFIQNVPLTEPGRKEAEKLKKDYQDELRRQQEEAFRKELKKDSR